MLQKMQIKYLETSLILYYCFYFAQMVAVEFPRHERNNSIKNGYLNGFDVAERKSYESVQN